MDKFLRFAHPLFMWGVVLTYGREATQQMLVLPLVILALGLSGMSQGFWRAQVNKHMPRRTGDAMAFAAGIIAIVFYFFLCIRAFALNP
jgi:hypothetical protein